jgi:hypothetical protein
VLQHRRWAHCHEGSDQTSRVREVEPWHSVGNTEAGRTNPHRLRLYLGAQNGDFKSPAEFRPMPGPMPRPRVARAEAMSGQKKTTSGSSQAERKAFRDLDAQEAMAEHEQTQAAFNDNRERLRSERLAREAADPAGGKLVAPTPQLPDDTPIDRLRLTARMREALRAAGLTTVGEIREKSDQQLLSIRDLGRDSLDHLRASLGVTSVHAVRRAANSDT